MDKLLEILEDIRDDIDFDECTDLVDGKVLNSFEVLQIVSEIDDAFNIVIPAADVVAENFNSVEAMWKMIQRLGGK